MNKKILLIAVSVLTALTLSLGAAFAAPAISEDKAKDDLKTFAYDMTSKANKSYAHTKANPQVSSKDGKAVASYAAIDPSSIEVTLKPTKSAEVPYVGIISYLETVYECTGADAKAAKKGNFTAVRATKMTEIYRYVNNKWVP